MRKSTPAAAAAGLLARLTARPRLQHEVARQLTTPFTDDSERLLGDVGTKLRRSHRGPAVVHLARELAPVPKSSMRCAAGVRRAHGLAGARGVGQRHLLGDLHHDADGGSCAVFSCW